MIDVRGLLNIGHGRSFLPDMLRCPTILAGKSLSVGLQRGLIVVLNLVEFCVRQRLLPKPRFMFAILYSCTACLDDLVCNVPPSQIIAMLSEQIADPLNFVHGPPACHRSVRKAIRQQADHFLGNLACPRV